MFGRMTLTILFICLFLIPGCFSNDNEDGVLRCKFDHDGCVGGTNLTNGESNTTDGSGNGSGQNGGLTCTATAPSIAKKGTVRIQVTATGGTRPYRTEGLSFSSATTVARSFSSTGTYGDDDPITVTDDAGNSAACFYRVVIRDNLNLACDIRLSQSEPLADTEVTFNLDVFGVPGSYEFKFDPDTSNSARFDGVVELTDADMTLDNKTHTYSSRGTKRASFWIKNRSTGETASCSKTIQVRKPKIQITKEPSRLAPIGNQIKLIARHNGDFISDNVLWTFSSDDSLIVLTQDGNKATVSTNSTSAIDHKVLVTATAGDESLSEEVVLTFAPVVGCSITASVTREHLNREITLNVQAANGSPVKITEVDPGMSGRLLSGENNPIRLSYSEGGFKTVRILAETTGSGRAICNDGEHLEIELEIIPKLACNVMTSPNPGRTWAKSVDDAPVTVKAIPSDTLYGPYRVTAYEIGKGRRGEEAEATLLTNLNGLSFKLSFFRPGSFPINLSIEDEGTGRSAVCGTVHTSVIQTPACIAKFIQNNQEVDEGRAHDPFGIFVHSNAQYLDIGIDPGAQVKQQIPSARNIEMPTVGGPIVYLNGGLTQARVVVRNPQNGAVNECRASLNLTSPASCSLQSGGHFLVEATSHITHPIARKDTLPTPIPASAIFHNAKPPVQVTSDDGLGNKLEGKNLPADLATVLLPIRYSGRFNPKISFTDSMDNIPDSCMGNQITADKRWRVWLNGAGTRSEVRICNYTHNYNTIWIKSNGYPASYDFHKIKPWHCSHWKTFKFSSSVQRIDFKTLYRYNPLPKGLVGEICSRPGGCAHIPNFFCTPANGCHRFVDI